HTTPPTRICTLSLHDALPILVRLRRWFPAFPGSFSARFFRWWCWWQSSRREQYFQLFPKYRPIENSSNRALFLVKSVWALAWRRSEEHTSELQSRENLVCRLL